jgi:coenzyme F420-reducing hydrogenase delta subunit/Pyruvate/2-oxoacid:ferredoxin oxidoreductase delta subunit
MTPRKGVFVVGPAQGRVDLEERQSQAKASAMAVRNLLKDGSLNIAAPVEIIDTGKCAVCLTCVRVCPEGAMITDYDKPASNPLACTGCGTCASECPQDAIIMRNESDAVYTSQISAAKAAEEVKAPELLVFVCANSAALALSQVRQAGWEGPAGARFIQVPCASKIDPAFVLQAFSEGFDGVLVLSCFEDACYSLKGNTWLGYRADHLRNLLVEAGIDPERLRRAGIAPSMKQESTALIDQMAADLAEMGPAGLRPAGRDMLERFTLELSPGVRVSP